MIKPILVENSGIQESYLDSLGCDVVYTNNNSYKCNHPGNDQKHKGVNELLDVHTVIQKYNIQDEDIVIKLTGRYRLLDKYFIDNVKQHMDTHDAILKFYNVATYQYCWDDCVLGLLAIRCKHLRTFMYQCRRSPECEIATHIRYNIPAERILELKDLHLECCFAADHAMLIV